MNFTHDLAMIAKENLKNLGIKLPDEWCDHYVCVKYIEISQRMLYPQMPYEIVYSKELSEKISELKQEEFNSLQDIEKKLKTAQPLTCYMSKHIKATATKKSDFMLKNWNIYHLHLHQKSKNLLFMVIERDTAYFVDIKPHPRGAEWYDRNLLEIIDRNWPQLLMYYPGAVSITAIPNEQMHDILKNKLVGVEINDKVVFPTNFGVAFSGDSNYAVAKVNGIFNQLREWEKYLKENEEQIREDVFNATGYNGSEPLDYELIVEKDFFVAYEKHSNAKLKMFSAE